MTSPGICSKEGFFKGLGLDIDTPIFSLARGDGFALGSFGHTGFTGSSLWIDPATQTVVILLMSTVHPDGVLHSDGQRKKIMRLRNEVATCVACAIIAQ